MEQQLIKIKKAKSGDFIRVLHVDGQKSFLELTKGYLSQFNGDFDITSVSSPSEASEVIRTLGIDLIISDGLVPLQDTRKSDNQLPFIIFSDDQHTDLAIEAVNLGADYYLQKGTQSEDVFKELSNVIIMLVNQYRITLSRDARAKSNQLLIDSFPNIMALISFKTREIIASNKAAHQLGADPGTICFESFFGGKGQCPWCKAPESFKRAEDQYVEIVKMGRQWACYWYYISEKYFMHYIEDITKKQILIEEWEKQLQENTRAN